MKRHLPPTAVLMLAALLPAAVVEVSSAQPAKTDPTGPKASSSASARASASSSSSAPASASASAPLPALSVDVMVLHASNTGGGIDPRIGPLPQLRKPPFSSYDTYKLLSQTKLPLSQVKPAETTLPNDRLLTIALKDAPATGRYKVSTSIQKRGGAFLPQLELTTPLNEPFFVAGQSYKDGVLVVGIKLAK